MKKLQLLVNDAVFDAHMNLAAEEFLLKNVTDGDILMLWRNSPSVIIGKNQNAFSQIDCDYVAKKNIKIARRLTGGGTVYHDLGNINYTFITDYNDNASFASFAEPVICALATVGIDAELTGRNDICINGKKVSGTALCVEKDRIMFHGTLLFDSELDVLQSALVTDPLKIRGKGIESVRSRVTNIKEHLPVNMTTAEFFNHIASYFEIYFGRTVYVDKKLFAPVLVPQIQALCKEKYSTWEWNLGTSPEFCHTSSKRYSFGTVELNIKIEKGIMEDVRIYGDFFGAKDVNELAKKLKGLRYFKPVIKKELEGFPVGDYIMGCTFDDFIELL